MRLFRSPKGRSKVYYYTYVLVKGETAMSNEICNEMKSRIEQAIPGAVVEVNGGGGHFTIAVTSAAFEGLKTLQKKRMVYAAITDLMAGDHAPVHAIDRLDTFTP